MGMTPSIAFMHVEAGIDLVTTEADMFNVRATDFQLAHTGTGTGGTR